jgi:hypothetical protein
MRLLKTVLNKKDEVIDQLKVEKGSIENELETVKKNSKDSIKIVKVKEKEILNLQKENCQILESLEAAKIDLQDLKLRVNKEKKDLEKKLKKDQNKDFMKNLLPSQVNQFQCNNCDVKMESVSKLKEHGRIFHMHTSGTQTNEIVLVGEATQCTLFKLSDDKGVQVEELVTEEEFEKYPCHYCNINIANEYHLSEPESSVVEHRTFIQKLDSHQSLMDTSTTSLLDSFLGLLCSFLPMACLTLV